MFDWYKQCKYYYDNKCWDKYDLVKMVTNKKISRDEYKQITSEEFLTVCKEGYENKKLDISVFDKALEKGTISQDEYNEIVQ